MPPKPPVPPLNAALMVLRNLLGWPQNELAAVLGCGPTLLSDYEAGRKPLSRERLDEIAAVLGLPDGAVDQTLAYVKGMYSRIAPEGGALVRGNGMEAVVVQMTAAAEVFARSILSLPPLRRAEEARAQARALWERMKGQPPARRRLLVESSLEFRNWALCELVCQKSLEAAADRADRALDLSGLAVRISELAPGEMTWRKRLQGYALAHLANARRVSGDLPAADETFARARSLWEGGRGTEEGFLNEALVLGLEASLRRDQRRLAEALTLLDQALNMDNGAWGSQLLVNRANVLELVGDFDGAVSSLREVAPVISKEEEPRLCWLVWFTMANNLLLAGRPRETEELLPELRELAVQLGNDLDAIRLRWLDGRIAAALGYREKAIATLSGVREDFGARRIAYDAALASLELAALFLEEGRTREVRALARQILWIFQAQGVHREALAALRLFCEAAEREAATLEMVRRMVDYLRRAQNDPSLQFENN